MDYNYFDLTLSRGVKPVDVVGGHLRQALGDHIVAAFAPSLGFATNQVVVLSDATAGAGAVKATPGVTAVEQHRLAPTSRPADGAKPMAGGIYVHRWFTIEAAAVDEFVQLSNAAWPSFEGGFETEVYGLFAAERTPQDVAHGDLRMLLMTRYRDLGEWQNSRQPGPEAARAFARRRELTRVALPRACILMPPPGNA